MNFVIMLTGQSKYVLNAYHYHEKDIKKISGENSDNNDAVNIQQEMQSIAEYFYQNTFYGYFLLDSNLIEILGKLLPGILNKYFDVCHLEKCSKFLYTDVPCLIRLGYTEILYHKIWQFYMVFDLKFCSKSYCDLETIHSKSCTQFISFLL